MLRMWKLLSICMCWRKDKSVPYSFARGEEDADSDIDIMIETTDKFMQKYRSWDAFVYINENIRQVIEEKFHKKVDIFDRNSNSSIKKMIENEACYV